MFETAGDIMKLCFGIGFVVLVIFLSMTLLYTIFILRDVSKVLDDVKEITDKVKVSIISPLRAANFLIEKIKPYVNQVLDMKKRKK